ncbi:MAG: hypothetical protein KKA81_10565 [Bacteroidetes bacterium]|nr:hypothetical protein [Bacteroidota bacterium]
MKKILLFVLLISWSFMACKQTQEVAQEEPPQQTLNAPPPDYTERQQNRQSRGLSVAEIQMLEDYANQKASFVCKINKINENPPSSDEQAAQHKEQIINLESRLKVIEVEIEKYLDSDVKRHYFGKALEQAVYRCSH